jgi:hypothetical protein
LPPSRRDYYEAKAKSTEKENQLRSARSWLKEHPDDEEALATRDRLLDETNAKITKDRKNIDWSKSTSQPFKEADKDIKELRTEHRNLTADRRGGDGMTPLARNQRVKEIESELAASMREATRDYLDLTRPPPAQRPTP